MNKRLVRHVGFLVVLALAGHVRVALALEGYPESWCRGGMFSRPLGREPNLSPGRVVGNGPAYLLSDDDGCPLRPSRGQSCRTRDSIRPGFPVAILPNAMPGLACVLDLGHPGQPYGWLPQARVQMSSLDLAPPLAAWRGKWRKFDDTIVLTTGRDGRLSVQGRAYWPGRSISPRHTGELSDTARPEGNRVTFSGEDPTLCTAKLELLGPNLLAANENGQCGGANVSFGGVYTRIR